MNPIKTDATKESPRGSAKDPVKPAKPSPAESQSTQNPGSSELEGGRRSSVDGKFEADHRPSR